MKKILLLSLILGSSASLSTAATTLNFTTGGGLKFITGSGAFLPAGSAVRMGTFNTAGANEATIRNSTNFAEINALFTPVAEGVRGTVNQVGNEGTNLIVNNKDGSVDSVGDAAGQVKDINNADITPGSQIFIWVFNGVDPATTSEWGIFTRSNWTVPAPNFLQIAAATFSTVDGPTVVEAWQGSVDPEGLRLVPEPSAILFLVATLGVFGLRRRR